VRETESGFQADGRSIEEVVSVTQVLIRKGGQSNLQNEIGGVDWLAVAVMADV
jgi:hypothetical protein